MYVKERVLIFAITVTILFSAIPLLAQNPLEVKYDRYKERFRTKFLRKTEDPRQAGNFLVIETRGYNGNNTYVDVTWYMGMYLSVLATEYHILKEKHLDEQANESIREINNMLIAINRLDSVAETYFGKEPSLNGFFVRSDIVENPYVMSQDQVWGLLYGFRFIIEFVDDEKVVRETRAIAERIVRALNPLVNEEGKKKKHQWMVIDPNGKVVQPPVDLYSTRYAFVLSLEAILGREVDIKGKSFFSKRMYNLSHAMTYHHFLFKQDRNMFNTYGILSLYILAEPEKALPLCIQVEDMVKKFYPEGVLSHFPLSAAILSHQKLDRNPQYYLRILQAAPEQGPEFNANSKLWNRTNIFGAFWQDYNRGEYTGLDYMLLYNLYTIYY